MIHLDTNAMIALLNGRTTILRSRYEQAWTAGQDRAISAIVHHELMFGAAKSVRREANAQKLETFIAGARLVILLFDEGDDTEAGDIRAHLKHLGAPIGPYDVLIAGAARSRGATLVTANTREFQRVPGLLVVDWAA